MTKKSLSKVYGLEIGGLVPVSEIAAAIGDYLQRLPKHGSDRLAWVSRTFSATTAVFPGGRGVLVANALTTEDRRFAVYFDPEARVFRLFEEFKKIDDCWTDENDPPEMDGVHIADWEIFTELVHCGPADLPSEEDR